MKAWLVTWEWMSDHAAEKDKVVSIIPPRRSEEFVRRYVEQIYSDLTNDLSDRLAFAKTPKDSPYSAEFLRLRAGGWYRGVITCGHHPWLRARKVHNLRISEDEQGKEQLFWEEYDLPEPP